MLENDKCECFLLVPSLYSDYWDIHLMTIDFHLIVIFLVFSIPLCEMVVNFMVFIGNFMNFIIYRICNLHDFYWTSVIEPELHDAVMKTKWRCVYAI